MEIKLLLLPIVDQRQLSCGMLQLLMEIELEILDTSHAQRDAQTPANHQLIFSYGVKRKFQKPPQESMLLTWIHQL